MNHEEADMEVPPTPLLKEGDLHHRSRKEGSLVEWRKEVLLISHLSIRLVVVVILQKSICMLYNNMLHLATRGELKGGPARCCLKSG